MKTFKVTLRDKTFMEVDAASEQEAIDKVYEDTGEEPLEASPIAPTSSSSNASSSSYSSPKEEREAKRVMASSESGKASSSAAPLVPSTLTPVTPYQREQQTGVWLSNLFPETASAQVRGDNYPQQVFTAGSDLLTLPGRLLIGPEDMNYTPEEAASTRQRIASDRTLLPLLGVGALGLPFRAGGALAKFGAPARVLATTGVGAAEGAGGSVASDLAAGREVSGTGAALGAGLGGLLTAPFAAARQVRIGDLPPDVGELAYAAGVHRGAAGPKGLDEASEKVLKYAKDVDKPHVDVLKKAQNQINDALYNAEQRAKELRKSNRITAAEFKRGTEGRQAVIDNLMAEDTWLTPEALMREARRVRSADPDLAQSLEDIAVDRLWQATGGRALTAAGDFRFGFDTPLEEVGAAQDALFVKALDQTKHLPAPKALLDAQKSGAAASALYRGLPGGKPAVAGQIIEKYLQVPKMAPAAGASGRTIVPFKKEDVGPQSSLIDIPEGDYIPEQMRGIIKFV